MSPDPVDLLRLAASRLDGRQNTKHARQPHVIRNTLFPQALLWDRVGDIFSSLNHLSSLAVLAACFGPFVLKNSMLQVLATSRRFREIQAVLNVALPKSHTAAQRLTMAVES